VFGKFTPSQEVVELAKHLDEPGQGTLEKFSKILEKKNGELSSEESNLKLAPAFGSATKQKVLLSLFIWRHRIVQKRGEDPVPFLHTREPLPNTVVIRQRVKYDKYQLRTVSPIVSIATTESSYHLFDLLYDALEVNHILAKVLKFW
jgi:hypothetical protein